MSVFKKKPKIVADHNSVESNKPVNSRFNSNNTINRINFNDSVFDNSRNKESYGAMQAKQQHNLEQVPDFNFSKANENLKTKVVLTGEDTTTYGKSLARQFNGVPMQNTKEIEANEKKYKNFFNSPAFKTSEETFHPEYITNNIIEKADRELSYSPRKGRLPLSSSDKELSFTNKNNLEINSYKKPTPIKNVNPMYAINRANKNDGLEKTNTYLYNSDSSEFLDYINNRKPKDEEVSKFAQKINDNNATIEKRVFNKREIPVPSDVYEKYKADKAYRDELLKRLNIKPSKKTFGTKTIDESSKIEKQRREISNEEYFKRYGNILPSEGVLNISQDDKKNISGNTQNTIFTNDFESDTSEYLKLDVNKIEKTSDIDSLNLEERKIMLKQAKGELKKKEEALKKLRLENSLKGEKITKALNIDDTDNQNIYSSSQTIDEEPKRNQSATNFNDLFNESESLSKTTEINSISKSNSEEENDKTFKSKSLDSTKKINYENSNNNNSNNNLSNLTSEMNRVNNLVSSSSDTKNNDLFSQELQNELHNSNEKLNNLEGKLSGLENTIAQLQSSLKSSNDDLENIRPNNEERLNNEFNYNKEPIQQYRHQSNNNLDNKEFDSGKEVTQKNMPIQQYNSEIDSDSDSIDVTRNLSNIDNNEKSDNHLSDNIDNNAGNLNNLNNLDEKINKMQNIIEVTNESNLINENIKSENEIIRQKLEDLESSVSELQNLIKVNSNNDISNPDTYHTQLENLEDSVNKLENHLTSTYGTSIDNVENVIKNNNSVNELENNLTSDNVENAIKNNNIDNHNIEPKVMSNIDFNLDEIPDEQEYLEESIDDQFIPEQINSTGEFATDTQNSFDEEIINDYEPENYNEEILLPTEEVQISDPIEIEEDLSSDDSSLPLISDGAIYNAPDNEGYKLFKVEKLPKNKKINVLNDQQIKNKMEQLRFSINNIFEIFKVNAYVEEGNYNYGPTVLSFNVTVGDGVNVARITKLSNNLKLRLKATTLRIQAPIPGKPWVGIEIPNDSPEIVFYKDVFSSLTNNREEDKKFKSIDIPLGKDIFGNYKEFSLSNSPHMLVAGTTGSGKSVLINVILTSILMTYKPNELRLMLIDPKMVEFVSYSHLPHLITPVINDSKQARVALEKLVQKMEERFKQMSEAGVRNIQSWNEVRVKKGLDRIPYIVVIIDELADLMVTAGKEVETAIARITQKARAAGIHIIVATQRPSTDVITGLIKSNIPTRIAFAVSSAIDSRTILDGGGAENLLGRGDMLVSLQGHLPFRAQSAFISDKEIDTVTKFIRKQDKKTYYDSDFNDLNIIDENNSFNNFSDPLFNEAIKIVKESGKASTSYLQRRLKVGYNKAADLIDALEEQGIVGPPNGSKPRDVY